MTKSEKDKDFLREDDRREDFNLYKSNHIKENFLLKQEYIKRSKIDRRSLLDRRILNLGPEDPDQERRAKKDRRKGWDDRVESESPYPWNDSPKRSRFKP
jgi:hypothetical protein